MKFAMAMLAMGGGVGAAAQAQAATIYTDTLDIPADQPLTAITVVGSTPQFYYGATPYKDAFDTSLDTSGFVTGPPANSAIGLKTDIPGLPSAGETFNPTASALTDFKGVPVTGENGSYIHLLFDSGGTLYAGTAYVDASAELETITYEAVPNGFAAVPEPDAWALLIAGAALTGGALRASRRRQAAIA